MAERVEWTRLTFELYDDGRFKGRTRKVYRSREAAITAAKRRLRDPDDEILVFAGFDQPDVESLLGKAAFEADGTTRGWFPYA